MANLSPNGRKISIAIATLFLLAALGLGAFSMFWVGWVKYTVNTPAQPSQEFSLGKATKFIYNTRHRGLFFYTVDDVNSQLVKEGNGNRYFPVVYNVNSSADTNVGFWSLTMIMKSSVGLHVGYLASVGLVAWMVVFSHCFGPKLVHFATALLVLGLVAGGVGLALFHIYIGMEKFSNIPALQDIYYNWPGELQQNTRENFSLSYGVHIGSLGAGVLALLVVILLATSWETEQQIDERAASDKVNIYTRDNLAYDDNLVDKPARAELWNGFDRLSEKRSRRSDRQLPRANYPSADYGAENGHHHHHHQYDHERLDRVGTPTRQHYHTDPGNFPIRY